MIHLVKLRFIVTFRSYTRTVTSRVESFFFFPLFALAMLNIYIFLPQVMWQALIFPAAPVMIFIVFFLFLAFMWISVPLMGFRLNESLDVKKLLHFPISFSTLYFALTVGNFLDVSSIIPIAFLGGLLNFFQSTGETEGLPGALLLCALFFVFLQLMYQLVILILYSILPRINPMKIMALILVVIVAVMVILNTRLIKVPEMFSIFNDENLKYHAYSPTGYFGICMYEFWSGNLDLGYRLLLRCVVWVLPLFAINAFLTFLTYQGIEVGLIRSRVSRKRAKHIYGESESLGEKLFAHPVITIFLIETKTLLRDWHFIFYKMMPGIVTPTLILLIIKYHFTQYSLEKSDPLFMGFIIAFIVLIIILFLAQAFIFVGNIFGYDREAITMLLTVPVDERSMLMGKNLFMLALLSVDAVVISFLTFLFFPDFFIQMTFFVFMESMVLILIGLGNFSSILYPYHVPFDKPTVSFQGTLIVAILSMFTDLVLLVMVTPMAIALFYLLYHKLYILLITSCILTLLYSIFFYVLLLNASARLLPRYRESIFQNVRTP